MLQKVRTKQKTDPYHTNSVLNKHAIFDNQPPAQSVRPSLLQTLQTNHDFIFAVTTD